MESRSTTAGNGTRVCRAMDRRYGVRGSSHIYTGHTHKRSRSSAVEPNTQGISPVRCVCRRRRKLRQVEGAPSSLRLDAYKQNDFSTIDELCSFAKY